MDNRPIGMFDSGVGGLTCAKALFNELPDENIIYFGDTARAPYGSRRPEQIVDFSMEISSFLIEQGVKAIAIGCNTTTALAIEELRGSFPQIPFIGLIQPFAELYVPQFTGSCIGVIATQATVNSGAYTRAVHSVKPEINVRSAECQEFVKLVEKGLEDSPQMESMIHEKMDTFMQLNKPQTLVLGCTHFPLAADAISRIYPGVELANPAEFMVKRVKSILEEKDMLADGKSRRADILYASRINDSFKRFAAAAEGDRAYRIKQQLF